MNRLKYDYKGRLTGAGVFYIPGYQVIYASVSDWGSWFVAVTDEKNGDVVGKGDVYMTIGRGIHSRDELIRNPNNQSEELQFLYEDMNHSKFPLILLKPFIIKNAN